MRIKNDQAGLTLVELLVTIVVASIVTLAACTMLLFGLRINNQSTKTSMGQNTVQVLMEALEDVAAEAKDLNVVSNPDSWEIKEGDKVLFSYVSEKQTVYSGQAFMKSGEQMVEIGTPFLKGIFASSVTYEDQLLTIDVQITEEDNYSTSIYCRVASETQSDIDMTGENYVKQLQTAGDKPVLTVGTPNYIARDDFLKVLASQYNSRGQIIDQNGKLGKYYSEWYIGGYKENSGWNKNTPWCACYLSWAMAEVSDRFGSSVPHEADVQKLLEMIESSANSHSWYTKENVPSINPADLIFFNFDEDAESDHVGVVLTVVDHYIYTIEGNTAGKVAVRKYDVNDKRIMGYGVLKWNTNNETESE